MPTSTPLPTSTPSAGNLIANPGFEIDANLDGKPDQWSVSAKLRTSNAVVHGGNFSGRLFATDDKAVTITQTILGITAGATYDFSGWANVPFTTDTFAFRFRVVWRDSHKRPLATVILGSFAQPTGGWSLATASATAPANAVAAELQLDAVGLAATVYVDDLDLRAR